MRVIDRHKGNSAYRSQTRHCEAPECSNATREGKPYCSEHVSLNSYASQITEAIAQRERDDLMVLNKRVPISRYNLRGITARAIIQHLHEHGPRTKARICKELGIEKELLEGYAKAMLKAKIVTLGRTHRGNETLGLRETS